MTATKSAIPTLEAWAYHRFIDLDPRQVTEISEDGTKVRIWILGKSTDWLPTENYEYVTMSEDGD